MLVVKGASHPSSLRCMLVNHGYGLGLDTSVSRPSRGAVVLRLGLTQLKFQTPRFRLGLETERLGLGLGLQGLGLDYKGLVHIPVVNWV